MSMEIKEIESVLSAVVHPAKDKDIVSLGMVENIRLDGNIIRFNLVFPSPDAMASSIKAEINRLLSERFPDFKIRFVELIREIKTKRGLELDEAQLAQVDNMIAVASGKGGVGKSTVAVNLAVALARKGYKVGLADADVYGPSVPKMTGTEDAVPDVVHEDGMDLIVPVEKFGVKWMSIGYFAQPGQALIWRGPMACNALKQMILQVKWGKLDYLLIDLPPGTGDIHISLVNDLPLTAAVVVSTPQAVALADVEKGVNMFRNKDINKPILGLVENMAWFTPEELPENRYYIFGKEGCVRMARQFGLPVLAQIPIVQGIRESGDEGTPAACTEILGKSFAELADKVVEASAKI